MRQVSKLNNGSQHRKMVRGIIISGFAGIGKTTIAEKYNSKIIDLESSDFKWVYGDESTANMSKESRKGVSNRRLNPEWPQNYMNAILEAREQFDIVLISQGTDIRDLLTENNIEFLLSFPSEDCKQEYLHRYISRGNQQSFVQLIEQNFEKWVQDLMQCSQKKLIINPGQHLEDVLKENGLI